MPSVIRNLPYTWLPKGSGEKGPGQFSNSNSHDAEPTYLKSLTNVVVRAGAWVATYMDTAYGNSGGKATYSMTVFNFYSGAPPTVTSKLVGSQYDPVTSAFRVWNLTDGVLIRTTGATGYRKMCFSSVKNRLYMADGVDAPIITTNATSYYAWGVNPPVANMSYNIGRAYAGNATVAGNVMTWISGDKFPAFSSAKPQDVFFNGVYYPAAAVQWLSPTSMTVSGVAAAVNQAYEIGRTVKDGMIAVTNGSANVGPRASGVPFVISAVNQAAPNDPVYFQDLVNPANSYTLGSIVDLNNIVITAVYTGGPTSPPNVKYQVNTGPMSWIGQANGYQYAYSYYDPVSGHVSSRSPVLQVDDGEPDNDHVSVNINNIVTTASARFTRIILWRSAKAGGELYPIASLPNTGGPLSYIDVLTEDSRLGTDAYCRTDAFAGTLQPGFFSAPRNNDPPPVDLNYIAYWDGRFWASSSTQLGILFFSARTQDTAGTGNDVGVPEESWPPFFTRDIPGSDNKITGLRVVGRNLFVLTDLAIYQVLGTSSASYTLDRVTTRGGGTSHFATCEIPGTDINAGGDVLAYLGNDARVHFLFANSGDYPQSYAVQDVLDAALPENAFLKKSERASLNLVHLADATYLVVQTFTQGIAFHDNVTLLFDLDRKVWFNLPAGGHGASCLTEGLLNNALTAFVGSFDNTSVYKFMDPTSLTLPSPCSWSTHFISPPGLERKQYKDFQGLVIYTNEPLALTTVNVYTDINGPTTLTRVDSADLRIALIYGDDDDLLYSGMRAQLYVPQGALVRGRIFQTQIVWNPTMVGSKIQAVRALWTYEDATENAGNV